MKYLEQAITAHQSGNAALAEQLYQKQLNETPNEHNALQLLGLLRMSTHRLDEAVSLMKQSLDIEPAQPHVWNNLGSCYKKLGRFDDASDSFARAIVEKEDFISAYKNLIYLYMHVNDSDSLWVLAEKLVVTLKGNAEALYLYGKAANFVGKRDVAIRTFESLVLGDEGNAAQHDLGIAYRLNKEPEKALLCFQKVLNQHPNNFSVLHNLGNTYSDLGHIDEAISFFKRAISINPNYVESHRNLNRLLLDNQHLDEYLDSYEVLLRSGQISTPLLFSYIGLFVYSKDFEGGLKLLAQYQQQLDGEVEFYDLKSQCLNGSGNSEEALECLRFGIGLNKHTDGLKLALINSYIKLEQWELAEPYLIELNTKFPKDENIQALCTKCNLEIENMD